MQKQRLNEKIGVSVTFCLMLLGCTGRHSSAQDAAGYIGMSLPAEFRAFAAQSPWNTPIPENPEIDPDSEAMIRNLKDKGKRLRASLRSWTIPVFVIDSTKSPRRDVRTTDDHLYHTVDPDGNGVAEGLPMPDRIWPDPARDGHMVLVDPAAMKAWEFSRARKLSGGEWTASRIDIWDLRGPGYREPFSGTYWWTSGAMGAGMPLIAGLIRPEEVMAGEIKHALLFASPVNRKSILPGGQKQLCSPPASRTDGQGIGPAFIPEGARLQLDPALDIDSLPISPATKTVARALQRYGMYNGMGSSHFKLFFQNLGPDEGLWKSIGAFDDLDKIPIEWFRVIKCNLVTRSAGKTAP